MITFYIVKIMSCFTKNWLAIIYFSDNRNLKSINLIEIIVSSEDTMRDVIKGRKTKNWKMTRIIF